MKVSELWMTLVDRRAALGAAIGQHLGIALVALLIAMIIAMPLAYWTSTRPKTASVLLQIAGVLQTIPSLALLGLLIPLVGIGTVPAVIALVVYALLPIYQNTYLGLTNVDPALIEAANAFGMRRYQRLLKLELPLAAQTILGGVRTALVMIIGTATLAALIGAGGLGSFILLGIDRNNTPLILIGAISSALLALLLSGLLSFLAKHRWQWSAGLVAVLIAGGGVVAWQSTHQPETITIAGKLGSEPDILINMYKDLIEEADPKVNVALKPNFGKTSFLFSAVKKGSVDIYPEFTGTVLESLVKVPAKQLNETRNAQQTYQLARQLVAAQADMTYLQPMGYENTYALAVPQAFAKKNQLVTISDLHRVQAQLHGGFTLEFMDRGDGLKGVEKRYSLQIASKSFEPALRYQAVADGRVNVVDAYSTDSELVRYQLKVLQDDRGLFPSYRGAPLMRRAWAESHPKVTKALNQLAGKITATEMQKMNYDVAVRKQSPARVAREYLQRQGLLRKGAQ